MKEPKVEVGILFEPQIEFILLAPYHVSGKEVNGKQTVTYDEGKILWNGRQYDELVFEPLQESVAAFELLDVTIGINFHWERKEDQRFQGSLKIIVENGKLTGINVIRVEDYDQRHLQRDECNRFSGTAEGTCSHLAQLAACKPFRFAN